MKFKISVALVALFVVISACKKTTVFNGAKINTLNDFVHGYSASFTYNENGTINTIVKTNGIKQQVYYSGDTVTVATLNGVGQTTSADIYVLNGSGYAASWQGEFVDQHNSGAYSYDGNGNVTQSLIYSNHVLASTDNYTNNSAKNAVEIQHINASTGVTTYDYLEYLNSNGNTVGVQNMGQYYLGVSSANLKATDVQIGQQGDTVDVISYRYRYNGSSDVDTLVSYHKNGTLADSITYIYF